MSDYTPTTEDVRDKFKRSSTRQFRKAYGEAFDRWLAAHDAEVTAKALERGVDELGVYVGDEDGDYWTGYRDGQRRQIHVLKMLAAEARADTTNNESEGTA